MRLVVRLAVALGGAVMFILGVRIWLDVAAATGALGIAPQQALGAATLRGDIGGFFLTVGSLALLAAFRESRTLIVAPVLLMSLALTGRLIGIAADGPAPGGASLIFAEAVLLLVFLWGRRDLGRG